MRDRKELVDKENPKVSMRRQCELLAVSRSSLTYKSQGESEEDVRIKRLLDEIYLIDPCLGSRRLVTVLDREHGLKINRKRLQRLRREMGQEAIWCRPRTTIPDEGARKYPYLLRNRQIERVDEVWCTDNHLRPHERRTCLPVRGHGLALSEGIGLGSFQYNGS